MLHTALIAEIEAQICRFAIMHADGDERPVFSHHGEVKASDCDGVLSAIQAYLSTLDIPCPKNLGLAIAAPVKDGVFKVTQSGWASSEAELCETFGFEHVAILNSAAASAISLGWLESGDAVAVGGVAPPLTPLPPGRYAVVTPEVGIGVSAVQISETGQCTVIDTEGGHMSFAPQTPLEIELLQRLAPIYGRVSYERLITWPGLKNIFAAVCEQEGLRPRDFTPMEIILYGRTGADPLCAKALDCFFGILGDFVGDVALAVGADQGVFVSGAFVVEVLEAMGASSFRERFDNKGRLTAFVNKLPTWALVGHAREMIGIARHLIGTLRDEKTAGPVAETVHPALPAVSLAEPERLASTLLDGVDVGVLVLNADLNIAASNERYWVGASAPHAARRIGSPARAYVDAMVKGKDWSPETAATVLERLVLRQPFSVERVAFGGATIRDEARPIPGGGWVITAVDITNSRRWTVELENITSDLRAAKTAADAANGAKTTFLATMSHEIRTPLNGVLGMAQAMAIDALTPQQAGRLEIIRQSGENLLAILNDILDLSKIEAGKLEIEEVEFDLEQLLMGAHSTFTALANKKGLSFCLATDDSAGGLYMGDPTRLRQILYNLVSNAIKFTQTGEVRVTTTYDQSTLCMKVADTGIGIPQDRVDSLFEKFMQVDVSTTRQYGGTGLGLAICRDLATLMGGEIKVSSILGQGTTFEISVPMKRLGDSLASAGFSVAEEIDPSTEASALRVLAAEDNSVNQLVLKTLLGQMGVEVTVVDDGEQAVEAWEAGDWDVILMDVQMPKMDGPTAVRLIRERELASGRRRTPIIALTANVMTHQINQYLEAGMDAYVGKPLQITTLIEAIVKVTDEVPDVQAA